MKRLTVAGLTLCSVLSSSPANAQQPAPQPLVEKVDVRVVNVDVTVTDRSGKPVSGLTRDDFEVSEDGITRPITHFDEVRKAAPAAQVVDERFKRKVLVLVDNLNTSKHARNEALRNLERFIDSDFAGDYEWSLAITDSRVHLLLPMTSNKARIHDVVATIARRGTGRDITLPIERDVQSFSRFGGSTEARVDGDGDRSGLGNTSEREARGAMADAFERNMNRNEEMMFAAQSVAAIADAARAFSNIEGKKIILLITGGLPIESTFTVVPNAGLSFGQTFAGYNQRAAALRDLLVREANASNTSFYIIGAEGLQPASMMPQTQGMRGSSLPSTSAMYWLARETGGRFLPGNRIGESLQEFDEISANFYSLAYTPSDDSAGYRRIKVRLKDNRGYHLQYRQGLAEVGDDVQLERTLRSFLGVTMQPSDFPIAVSPNTVRYSKTDKNVGILPFALSVPMNRLQYIEQGEGSKARVHVYVSVFDRNDRFVTLARYVQDVDLKENEQPTGRMVMNFPGVTLRKGDYRLVVAVRDEVAESLGVSVQRVKL